MMVNLSVDLHRRFHYATPFPYPLSCLSGINYMIIVNTHRLSFLTGIRADHKSLLVMGFTL